MLTGLVQFRFHKSETEKPNRTEINNQANLKKLSQTEKNRAKPKKSSQLVGFWFLL
jgi:hypothetical protein